MRKKKVKTFLVITKDGREYSLNDEFLENITSRLSASRHTRKPSNDFTSCSFKSFNYFRRMCEDDNCGCGECKNYMRTRQLANIGFFLRKALLKHNWNEAAHLTQILCNPGICLYKSTVICSCLLLLLNHPNSSPQLLEKFIRGCTHYVLNEEIEKFIKIVLAIREEPLPIIGPGKYVRKEQMYKAVDEMCFKDL